MSDGPAGALDRVQARGYRIYLRRPEPRDADEYIGASRRSRELHGAWLRTPTDREEYERLLHGNRSPRGATYLVRRLEDDALTGFVRIGEIVHGLFQSGYLSYGAFTPFDGQGYLTEGLDLLIRHAFRDMKLHRLEANIQPGNTTSIELVKRCGFRNEGYSPRYLKIGGKWCDHERWAILVDEWKPLRPTERRDLSDGRPTREGAKRYWSTNLRYLGMLLAVWGLVSFGCSVLLVDQLDQIRIGGFKLGFWFAQQGSIYVFVILIFVYVALMNRLDKKHDVQEKDGD